MLCFSEYYNGAWQPVKSSDVNAPLDIMTVAAGTFDRSMLDVRPYRAADPTDEALYVHVTTRDDTPFVNSPWMFLLPGFVVHNTHSEPIAWSDLSGPVTIADATRMRTLPPSGGASGNRQLRSSYATRGPDSVWGPQYPNASTVDVLTGTLPQAIRQAQSDTPDQWSMPFLLSDARNVFYVSTSVAYRWFSVFQGYGLVNAGRVLEAPMTALIPPVVVSGPPQQPGQPVEITSLLGDPLRAQDALTQAPGLRAALGSSAPLDFGGVSVGASGTVTPATFNATALTSVFDVAGIEQVAHETHDIQGLEEKQ